MIKKYELLRDGINYYNLEVDKKKFIITNSPTNKNISGYLKELKYNNTNIIVRFGEKRYDEDLVKDIDFVDLYIEDGSIPNEETINIFLNIIRKNDVIAVHCISGLGRAPMMVVIAMILEYGMKEIDSIVKMRQTIPNSLNTKQINFLKNDLKKIKKSRCCMIIRNCTIM